MLDPTQLPDAHGLSIDSMRGAESRVFIRPEAVGNTALKNYLDPSRDMSRAPLSYHEAGTLDAANIQYNDSALHPAVADYRKSAPVVAPSAQNTQPTVRDPFSVQADPVPPAANRTPDAAFFDALHPNDSPDPRTDPEYQKYLQDKRDRERQAAQDADPDYQEYLRQKRENAPKAPTTPTDMSIVPPFGGTPNGN